MGEFTLGSLKRAEKRFVFFLEKEKGETFAVGGTSEMKGMTKSLSGTFYV